MSTKDTVIYGKYQLLEQLARGGMAEVFKAKAHGVEGFEKILVIKRILPELSENRAFVNMFINEAKIAVTLSHANIVQVFDLGWAENTYFIAMEYIAGMDLSTLLHSIHKEHSKRMLPPELAVFVVSELAKGLDYAHRRRDSDMRPLNIIHRDVSPQNVLISYEGEVKLTDFGIAKARTLVQAVTELGIIKGKYAYMAPEQLEGGVTDARTDIFAVGTLLFKMLSGVNPFLGKSVYETLQRIRSGDIPKVSQFVPNIPNGIDALLSKTLAHDPNNRFASAGQLYDALIEFLYDTGQRVGAHELATFINAITVDRKKDKDETASNALKAAFDGDASLEPGEKSANVTEDTRVLRGGRLARRQSESKVTTLSSDETEFLREKTEWRDVTVLAILCHTDDSVNDTTVVRLVERFNGRMIDKLPGTVFPRKRVFCALFGEKNPDGRDTDNAAHCALRISRSATASSAEAGKTTTVCVGIHTGRILINLSGDRVENETYNKLIKSALSLAEKCEPGYALVTDDVSKGLRGRYQLVAAGDSEDKLFILASERGISNRQGLFIGRRKELKLIGDVLAEVNQGQRRAVGLSGEDGSGKSRVLVEIMRRLGLAGHSVGLHIVTLIPRMKEIPLSAIQQMLRVVLGLDEFDPEALLRDRTTRLRELGLLFAEQEAIAAVLGYSSQEEKQRAGYRILRPALQRIIEKLAEDRMTLFAWDGAEYMDDDSVSVVDEVLRSITKSRIAVILCYQFGFVPRWVGQSWFTEIAIEPLADHDVARLIASQLGYEEIPIELLRDVTNKCGGNPLYIEEYLASLVESGAIEFEREQIAYRSDVADIHVPKTLRGIVSSRIGKLSPVARYIIQVASLVGEQFNTDLVTAAAKADSETTINALSTPEMKSIVKQLGPSEYAFAYDLVPKVVRDGLTVQARKDVHRAIATSIESLYPERLNDMAERLAHHYREAGDLGKALDYLVVSASRLEVLYDFDGAITRLLKAIDILATLSSSERQRMLQLYERIGELSLKNFDLDKGATRMKRALEIAEGLKADKYIARFSLLRGRLLVAASRIEEGRRWLDQARHVAGSVTDTDLSREILLATAAADSHIGEYEKAVKAIREAMKLARESGNLENEIDCFVPLAMTYSFMQDYNSALDTLAQAISKVEGISDSEMSCRIYQLESQINHLARNEHAAIRAANMALELAKDAGLTYQCAISAFRIGNSYLYLQDYTRAFTSLRYSYELATEHGFTRLQMSNLKLLGFIDAMRFQSDEGTTRLVEAVDYAKSKNDVLNIIHGEILLAIIEQGRGHMQAALDVLREARKTASERGNRRFIEYVEQALRSATNNQPIQMPL
jgi:eukaryotic-like serine/threonine-protein kinase